MNDEIQSYIFLWLIEFILIVSVILRISNALIPLFPLFRYFRYVH